MKPKICQLCEEEGSIPTHWIIRDGQRICICDECMDIIIDDHIIGDEDE